MSTKNDNGIPISFSTWTYLKAKFTLLSFTLTNLFLLTIKTTKPASDSNKFGANDYMLDLPLSNVQNLQGKTEM